VLNVSDAEAAAAAPPKSKKMLIIIIVAVLLVGAGAAFFMMKKNAAEGDEDAEEAPAHKAAAVAPGTPPAYLPLDNMVVNLADPGGERVAQIGVTLELGDAHDMDVVKAYVPSIRSKILLLISQRTADELLSREGKEKLTEDIMEAAGSHFEAPEPPKGKKKKKEPVHENPVHGVLFSSFIVQ
jgi:flagellar FliL protein